MTLFTIVSTLAAIMVVFSWGMILVAYLVYRRQRPDLHAGSIFKMPAGVVMSWVSLLFFAFAIFIMIFYWDTLLALLASPLWFIALWGFWKLKQRREGQLQLDNQSAYTPAGPGGRLSRGRLDACLCPVAAGALPGLHAYRTWDKRFPPRRDPPRPAQAQRRRAG